MTVKYHTLEEYRASNRARSKAYYDKNREEVIAKRKAYYEKNKEEILAKRKAYYQKKKMEGKASK